MGSSGGRQFARASLRETPEIAAITPSAGALARERLVRTAQSMAAAADQHVDRLREAEFPADFLDQMRAAAAAVQRAFDAGITGRVRRTGVTKEIRAALADGRRAVATLDALVGHAIVGNEPLEREWRAAKRVRKPNAAASVEAPAEIEQEVRLAA